MILDIIIIVLVWEYVASIITAAIILKELKIDKLSADTAKKWIDDNPRKACFLTILNIPMLIISPLLYLIYSSKRRK